MRRLQLLSVLILSGGLLVPLAAPVGAATTTPQLVAVRAAHHPGMDRVVFEFAGGLPSSRSASYVSQLLGDASGLPVRIAGRAVLKMRFSFANAHDSAGRATAPSRVAYNLPNLMSLVRAGDFEAVVTYGIGLMSQQPYRMFTLTGPPRVVVDIGAGFPTIARQVWFFNQARFLANTPPFYTPVWRRTLAGLPATTLLHRMYAGPTASPGCACWAPSPAVARRSPSPGRSLRPCCSCRRSTTSRSTTSSGGRSSRPDIATRSPSPWNRDTDGEVMTKAASASTWRR